MPKNYKLTSEQIEKIGHIKVAKGTFTDSEEGTRDFYTTYQGETALVFALTQNNEVVLVRQFRPGPAKIVDELPGGKVDAGEAPIDAAKRELLEETGYTGDFKYLGSTYIGPNSNGIHHVFVCTDAKQVSEQELDEEEDIDIVVTPVKNFIDRIKNGEYQVTGAVYMALYYLDLR